MNIDEAILHSEEVAERYERMEDSQDDKLKEECLQCAADHRQLAAWLRELKELRLTVGMIKVEDMKSALTLLREYKAENNEMREQIEEYKRLLKAAVEYIKKALPEVGTCDGCAKYDEENCKCKGNPLKCRDECEWEHEAEALDLIGKENETEDRTV